MLAAFARGAPIGPPSEATSTAAGNVMKARRFIRSPRLHCHPRAMLHPTAAPRMAGRDRRRPRAHPLPGRRVRQPMARAGRDRRASHGDCHRLARERSSVPSPARSAATAQEAWAGRADGGATSQGSPPVRRRSQGSTCNVGPQCPERCGLSLSSRARSRSADWTVPSRRLRTRPSAAPAGPRNTRATVCYRPP